MAATAKYQNIAPLIRRILDGNGAESARRRLIAIGGPAVDPVLCAITGDHGRMHPGAPNAIYDLLKVLAGIARRDVDALAEALTHETPGFNAVVWAIGHSKSRHARRILKDHLDHDDPGVRASAGFHLRRGRPVPRKPKPRKPGRKTAAKTASKKTPKKPAARKKGKKTTARKKPGKNASK